MVDKNTPISVVNYTDENGTKSSIPLASNLIRPHMHNIMCDQTTASGTWHYQFELENDVEAAYTQTGQIGHYLFTKDSRLRIPATGLCVYNGDKYWITAVKATTDNMLTFEMYNITDGTFKDDISSGAVDVIDVVS